MFAPLKRLQMTEPVYKLVEDRSNDMIKFYFISKGRDDLIKAIQYNYFRNFKGMKVYNLGFGDYDFKYDDIDDNINTDNGDVYKVFNTVLSSIPRFFSSFPKALMIVQGSDSSVAFREKCRLTCIRKCETVCKKMHRRINIYAGYVNKNYETLKQEYTFYSGVINTDNEMDLIDYIPGVRHQSIVVMKNNS
jgi:hypothetical protein